MKHTRYLLIILLALFSGLAYYSKIKPTLLAQRNSEPAAANTGQVSVAQVLPTPPKKPNKSSSSPANMGETTQTSTPAKELPSYIWEQEIPELPDLATLEKMPAHERQIRTQVHAARKLLKEWQSDQAVPETRTLKIIYWTPNDHAPSPRYRERLSKILHHIQAYYAKEMQRLGFGPLTFSLEEEADGMIKIHTVTGKHHYNHYKKSSGFEIRKECAEVLAKEGIDVDKETIAIFCNLTRWNPEKRTLRHSSPYYARGTQHEGTAWQVDSPLLDIDQITNKGDHIRDGEYGFISLGKYNSIFIGGIAHELGHAFSLPHNKERSDEGAAYGTALMGAGNRTYGEELRGESKGSFITLAHGLRLASLPLFNKNIKQLREIPPIYMEEVKFQKLPKGLRVTGKIVSKIPPYGIVVYLDPDGGGDYDSTNHSAVVDAEGFFSIDCWAFKPNSTSVIRLVPLLRNGSNMHNVGAGGPFRYPVRVDEQGEPVLKPVQQAQLLNKLGELVAQQKKQEAESELHQIRNQAKELHCSDIAESLIGSFNDRSQLKAPNELNSQEFKSISLSDCKHESIQVGYDKPLFNRYPNQNALIYNKGFVYSKGIYAHARSKVVYQLGGRWKRLRGEAGLVTKAWGNVSFKILADGKEVWKVAQCDDEKLHHYDIDLTGVKVLELISGPGKNDNLSAAWSFWYSPVISR